MTPSSRYDRRLLVWMALATFAGVGGVYALFEVPGLGLEHLFYIAIATLAVANGPVIGLLGGVFATVLYALAIIGNTHTTSANVLTAATGIRCATYVATGLLIGWFARSNQGLVERMRELAERDSLTGLLNWRSFEASLKRRCGVGRPFVLLLGDLDNLKEINDQRGHAEGNVLLCRVGDALAERVRSDDAVARIGGDEFGILASLAAEADAPTVSRRLEAHLEQRDLSMSWGWAIFPTDADNPTDLFRRADERLYESKLARKAGVSRLPARAAAS